ncbi:MORN repeat variant [bacterium BMS3Abin03]|nr:MORN repeat variant [bacterium BMS3Abin03]
MINKTYRTFVTLILLSIFSVIFISCSKNEVPESQLEMRDTLIYKKGSSEPFTGREKARVQDKIIEYDVVNGVKNGEFKLYQANGTLEISGQIENNKNVGKWQYFYPSGELESEGYFVNDNPEGKWVWYYPSGNLKEEGNYIKGKRIGLWKQYDEQGKVLDEKTFELNDSTEIESSLNEKIKPD